MPVAGQGAQRAGIGQVGAGSRIEPGTQAQVFDIAPWPLRPRLLQAPGIGLGKAAHQAQAHANGQHLSRLRLERAVPVTVAHIHRPYLDTLAPGLLQQLVGAVEAHGPAVDQRAGENRRFMALEPAAGIAQQGKAGRVRFREAIAAKALDLLEDALGKRQRVTIAQHALHQPFAVRFQAAVALPGGHAAA
ncbi:hypothetical protein D3C75_614250 [compost metagenome]